MHFNIVTLFPEFFAGPLDCGLLQRARAARLVSFSFINPRDLACDKRRTVDDRPYGGGPGMVLMAEPISRALQSLGFSPHSKAGPGPLFLFKAGGRPFTQKEAGRLALERLADDPCLTLICGRYEGVDARLEEIFPIESLSVGDFVLNGGEAAALCLIEAVSRLRPGFMGHAESGAEESFSGGLLEYPQYTRPETFAGLAAPAILRSGDHRGIARWRRQASLRATLENRPDLLSQAALAPEDREFISNLDRRLCLGANLYCALVHYPVLDREENSTAASLTNLDIHDISRSSCSYGLGAFYVLSPLEDQRELLREILFYWTRGRGALSNPDRAAALALVREGRDVEGAVEDLQRRTGQRPLLIGTSARGPAFAPPLLSFAEIAGELAKRPVLLLFGTGHGLAPEALALCDAMAPSLRPLGGYNHLSVRAAAAIAFDRILNDWR
ncbi:MAG: tRNA (guanosine(37)-N1)-methyltransferase TrmD [Desulfovibrio sp.]|jgi:tRNA (guanine37-N1)-methyltransferase|nr:tRNA (guanosine(37)-N1)-methyltransferase TrmD [Desulfovibrio sp.]